MRIVFYRLIAVLLPLTILEVLCREHVIKPLILPAPSRILVGLLAVIEKGAFSAAILKTLANVGLAIVLSVAIGIAAGAVIHRVRLLRALLEPLFAAYYAIPIYAFYPLFIVLFGLGDVPQVLIGFMLAVVAVIVNTLNGLDRVARVHLKTAQVYRLSAIATALKISLPSAAPYLLTGVKLALAYAFIGVIGAEFIMSRTGIGYEISFAYNNFDNRIMYPLILLILVVSILLNAILSHWERLLMQRRGQP